MPAGGDSAAKATGWDCYFSCTRWVLWVQTASPVAFWQKRTKGIRWMSLACAIDPIAPRCSAHRRLLSCKELSRRLWTHGPWFNFDLRNKQSWNSHTYSPWHVLAQQHHPTRSHPGVSPTTSNQGCASLSKCPTFAVQQGLTVLQTFSFGLAAEPSQILFVGICREACIELRLDPFRSKPCFFAF